jgi:hypothetical protein
MAPKMTALETFTMVFLHRNLPHDVDAQLVGSNCLDCIHLIDLIEGTCQAFTGRIPEEIRRDAIRHDQPFPGDHGLRYCRVATASGKKP